MFSARLGETYENAFAQVAGIFQLEVGDDQLIFVNLDFGGIGLVVCVVVAYVASLVLAEKGKDLTGLTLKTLKKS